MGYRWTLTDLNPLFSSHTVLDRDPIGWDEGVYSIRRSEVYKGAFHEYTTSLRFHCDGGGKGYIDNIYERDDIDGRIDCLIEYDCDDSGTYDILFNGIINLSSYQTDGQYTTVNIEKSDLLTKMFSRDEVVVDLKSTTSIGQATITAPNDAVLSLHSQNIFFQGNSVPAEYPLTQSVTIEAGDGFGYRGYRSPSIPTTISELDSYFGFSDFSDFGYPGNSASTTVLGEVYTANSLDIEYPATFRVQCRFAGTFKDIYYTIASRINTAHNLAIAWGGTFPNALAAGQFSSLYVDDYSTSLTEFTQAFDTGAIDTNITLNFNDKVWIYWFEHETILTGSVLGDLTHNYIYDIAQFNIQINSVAVPTTAKSILVHEAFNQVVDSIADSDGNFYSEFYGRTDSQKRTYAADGCGSKIAILNGLNLRKIEKSTFASFNELFKAFDCLHNIGMGLVNGFIRVEPIEYFFDKTTKILTLPLVNRYSVKNDNSRYFNKINVGYSKWESEFHGGLDEVNTSHEYSTKISSTKNILSKLCNYIASGYSIEFTRRKWNDNQTEDWRYDNDNFVIATNRCITKSLSFDSTFSLINFGVGSDMPGMVVGDTVSISGTAFNNGTYTILTIVSNTAVSTKIVVSGVLVDETTEATFCNITHPNGWHSELYSDSFSYGSGMTSLDTAYNIRLTPARMLLAHANTITAGLQVIQDKIKFVNGFGNTSLQCSANLIAYTDGCQEEYSGQQLFENQDFEWNDPNVTNIVPIWLPEIYSFEYPLTYDQFKTIKANPYGYIEFYKFVGEEKRGFILSMEYQMKTGMTKFELLKAHQ